MQIINSVVNENYTTKPTTNEIKVNDKVMTDSKIVAEKCHEYFTMLSHTCK